MRSTRPVYSTLFLLLLTLLTCLRNTTIARAADDEAEEYDVKARVVRISLMSGEVTLKRKDNTEWEQARLNYALVEGDTISTAADSRVEIQVDARNFVRLGANSILRIVTLRDEGVALSVVEGTASVRLAKFAGDKEYFEVDAPKTTLAVERSGLYRIDVGKDGHVRLTARDGGRARIYSETSGFALRDGRAADLIIDGPDAGEWEMLMAARDPWDDWLDERERYLAERLRYDTQYYDNDLWGAEDLDAYGAWAFTNDYGWIWRPQATVINNYNNWAPYRYGQWTWVDPYGWTWAGNEPWGWAPYHYGRWIHYNNYWAWCPRSQYYLKRSWWRPALVAFVSLNLSFGDEICWYPLSYHHRDPRSRNYHRGGGDDRRDGRDGRGHDDRNDRDDRRRYPIHWGGVTAIPARDFGGRNPRPHPADERWARRVVSAQPLPDVPVRPAREINRPATGANGANGANGNRPERRTWARRDGSVAGPDFPQRRTGAAERNPALPLDTELRRARVWNGREARRQEFPVPTGGAGAVETRPTGVVERPTRAIREVGGDVNPRNNVDRGDRGARDDRDVNRFPERDDRVARPNRSVRQQNVPRSSESNEPQVAPSDVPVSIPANAERPPSDRPARSEPYHRPAPVDRGERPELPERRERNEESPRRAQSERRSEPAPASEQPSRHEQPTHSEPPARNDPPPRSDPPPHRSEPERSEPAPRNDPPPRNDPSPRSDPPPQRSEPERSEPQPRNEPPPLHVEPPARSESPRSEPTREENERPKNGKDPR